MLRYKVNVVAVTSPRGRDKWGPEMTQSVMRTKSCVRRRSAWSNGTIASVSRLLLVGSSFKKHTVLAAALVVPIVVLVTICTKSVFTETQQFALSRDLQKNILSSRRLAELLKLSQQERGMSCVYLTSTSNNTFSHLQNIRTTLDGILADARHAPNLLSASVKHKLPNQQTLMRHRDLVSAKNMTCMENLEFYTSMNKELMDLAARAKRQGTVGQFWALVDSLDSLSCSIDSFGITRALGGAHFAADSFSTDAMPVSFLEALGSARNMLNLSLSLSEFSFKQYMYLCSEKPNVLISIDYWLNLMVVSPDANRNPSTALSWFSNMTDYINILVQLELRISERIVESTTESIADRHRSMGATFILAVLVLCTCPPITFYYAISSKRLFNKVIATSDQLRTKSKQLYGEQLKTESLLSQMLPKSVLANLKLNKPTKPEFFNSVTVSFSDIVGFTVLTSKSSPMQIVTMLNQLYCLFDGTLDAHDVYKVETIGDAYMIASGLPMRNGNKHVNEIATVALKICFLMKEFTIPHMHPAKMLLRTGIHTGPCAAGVVGEKMPRYCLFGDTINTASRLQSAGFPGRIQLSKSAKEALEMFEEFTFIERGSIELKGKGSHTTYWLTSKSSLEFVIDISETETAYKASTHLWS